MGERTKSQVTQAQVAKDFDNFASDYEERINSVLSFAGREHKFYVDIKREHLLRLGREHFSDLEALDVLDLGCGLGGFHPGLEGKFRELHGVDVSEQSIQMAAARHPFVLYSTFDGEHLPYRDGQFSIVFAVCVMHHVPRPRWNGFVAEMLRVTKSGGLALVFEHNPYNPATQYIVKSCEIDKDAVLLRPGKLRVMFTDAGFDKVYSKTIISVPPSGPFLTWLDSVLGYLPFGAQYYLSGVKSQP
jgi:ubiquinone/menaquinone biosynthesis C-methylase UbiE